MRGVFNAVNVGENTMNNDLFDKEERYTEKAHAIEKDIYDTLKPLVEKYSDVAKRDLQYMMYMVATDLILEALLDMREVKSE